ncbi:helix-turn-helix domain-containing protein [Nonomuraea sp. NPDC050783]|uniref:helix-turn-helix domain-containing protein n=1 Tax=Nonomuraea sp. NPDC050783 TaxID=3154634 RepID=UPI0034670A93
MAADDTAAPAPEPVHRYGFTSADAEETTECIRQMYTGNRTVFRRVNARSRITVGSVTAGPITADRAATTPFTFQINMDPFDYVMCGQIVRGALLMRTASQEVRLRPGEAYMYPISADLFLESGNFDVAVLRLPVETVQAVAAQYAGIDPRELRFTSMTPVSPALGRHFTNVLAMIHKDLARPDPALCHPLVATSMLNALAIAIVAAFPNTTMTTDYVSGPGAVGTAAMRRAIAYIETHADQPITTADIAAAAGTTARAVQYAFRRHHDTTPMGYLRRIRLERVHRDLQAADPADGATVALIAARWGFSPEGRFTAFYRDRYGVLPSQTLRAADSTDKTP